MIRQLHIEFTIKSGTIEGQSFNPRKASDIAKLAIIVGL